MQPFSTFIVLIVSLLTLVLQVNAAQPNAPPLHTGDMFPQFSGQTLTGKSLTLPLTAADKPVVLVFSFSRKAGQDARLWNEHLSKDFPNAVSAYGVILLESAPKLFRGMAVSGIKSSMPLSVQDRTIVLYQDERLWKQRLDATDTNHAYVLLLGSSGQICWTNSSAFSDIAYARLKKQLGI